MIIDNHTNLTRPKDIKSLPAFKSLHPEFRSIISSVPKDFSGKKLKAALQKEGIVKAVTFGYPSASIDVCKKMNDIVHEEVDDFFIPLAVVSPKQTYESLEEIDRCKSLGFKGIKLKPNWQDFSLKDFSILDPIMKFLQKNNLVCFVHVDHFYQSPRGSHPSEFIPFAEHYKKNKIVAGHLAGLSMMYMHYPPIQKKLSHVYFDAHSPRAPGLVKVAQEIVPDRLMFGSDYPHDGVKEYLKKLMNHGITEKTLFDNARKFYGVRI